MQEFSVLCFGDSNTYGQCGTHGRWPSSVRWTRRLQTILGPSFYVIEEGLSGRTTDLGSGDEQRFNGRSLLQPCLGSHEPVEMVAIMLGTNDLRPIFERTPEQIATALGDLVDDVHAYGKNRDGGTPRVLLMSPAPLDNKAKDFATTFSDEENEQAVEKSKRLARPIQQTALTHSCEFLDIGTVAHVGNDGVHLDQQSHEAVAKALAVIINRIRPR